MPTTLDIIALLSTLDQSGSLSAEFGGPQIASDPHSICELLKANCVLMRLIASPSDKWSPEADSVPTLVYALITARSYAK